MQLDDWLVEISKVDINRIDLGLTRVNEVAQQLELLDFGVSKIILVGGTNGKGTTCAFLESLLLKMGYSTGVYSSPHLLYYNERLRINNKMLSDEKHIEALSYVYENKGDIDLTYFELSTLACFYLLQRIHVDFVILEVGLGGRLDATNIVSPDVSIITSISYDHTEYLGDTLYDIAAEKAGIFRQDKPAVIGLSHVPESMLEHASMIKAPMFIYGHAFQTRLQGNHWDYIGMNKNILKLPQINVPLSNIACALLTVELFGISLDEKSVQMTLSSFSLAGRLEKVSTAPYIYLDVAHNQESITYLLHWLSKQNYRCCYAICGVLKDKLYSAFLPLLQGIFTQLYFVNLPVERTACPQKLSEYVVDSHVKDNIESALKGIFPLLGKEDMLLIFGSFYTVVEAKKILKNNIDYFSCVL